MLLNLIKRFLATKGLLVLPKDKAYLPWPTAFSTVDVAIVDQMAGKILLGRKKSGNWCIIGGFTDPTSTCDEEDACRELWEETHLKATPSDLRLIGNCNIPDGRYEGTANGIRTHFYLFSVNHKKVTPIAGDDIEEVCWFDLKDRFKLVEGDDPYIQGSHKILIRLLKQYMGV